MECMLKIVFVTRMSLSRAMQEQLPRNDCSALLTTDKYNSAIIQLYNPKNHNKY